MYGLRKELFTNEEFDLKTSYIDTILIYSHVAL